MSILIVVAVIIVCITLALCTTFRKRLQQAASKRFGWIPKPGQKGPAEFIALPNIEDDDVGGDGTGRLKLPVHQSSFTIRQTVPLELSAEDANMVMHKLDCLTNDLRRPPTGGANVNVVDHSKDI